MKLSKILFFLLFLSASPPLFAQNLIKKDSLYKFFQPYGQIQFWTVLSLNERQDVRNIGQVETVDNRVTPMLRRARIGFRGEPYKNFRYQVLLFYDQMGRDDFSATRGQYNDNSVGIFDAFGQWKMSKKSDLFHLTFGFFRPQISRESITPVWAVNSFEKATNQNYIRQFIIGRGNGRSTGLNLGGLKQNERFGINYNLGIFNNYNTGNTAQGSNVGTKWSPVLVGRLAFTFGQAEMKNYQIAYDINYFNQRKGLTLAVATSQQGATDIFQSCQMYSVDMLFNYGILNLDGEWNWMIRTKGDVKYQGQTGHIRLGINALIARKYFVEPMVMLAYFKGDDNASQVKFMDGEDLVFDTGVNWYLDRRNVKITLHYVAQTGYGLNNFYVLQNGRKVEKGNYVGLGLNFTL